MNLIVHRYGAIGDTVALSAFLAPLRSQYDTIILSGQSERLRLIDDALYDEVVSYDLARDRVHRLAEKADLSVSFGLRAMEGFQRRFDPILLERGRDGSRQACSRQACSMNIYDYMRSCAIEAGGQDQVVLAIPKAAGQGLLIYSARS